MPSLLDGSHCCAIPCSEGIPLISVGWLSGDSTFPTGGVSGRLFRLLCAHARSAWTPPYAYAGMHACDLCQFGHSSTSFDDFEFSSASKSELFIPTGSSIFVAPSSIIHYIAAHRYLPPDDFIAAVEACPPQRSTAYLRLLLESGGRAWFAAFRSLDSEADDATH